MTSFLSLMLGIGICFFLGATYLFGFGMLALALRALMRATWGFVRRRFDSILVVGLAVLTVGAGLGLMAARTQPLFLAGFSLVVVALAFTFSSVRSFFNRFRLGGEADGAAVAGSTAIEYGLIASLVAVAIITGAGALGGKKSEAPAPAPQKSGAVMVVLPTVG